MNLDKFRKRLEEICRQNGVAMLGVFGSVARGEETPESDVDLLVKLSKPVGLIEFIRLEDKFVEIFKRKVDLATEESLHPLIRQNVFNDLKVLYDNQK
jgi:predicted nucleotidyltransferase